VVVHERVYKPFLEQFVARARSLRVGNGLDPETEMGPSVSQAQLETVAAYVEIGKRKERRWSPEATR
jgi:aldehyde dehydrogenase (NAD+)